MIALSVSGGAVSDIYGIALRGGCGGRHRCTIRQRTARDQVLQASLDRMVGLVGEPSRTPSTPPAPQGWMVKDYRSKNANQDRLEV